MKGLKLFLTLLMFFIAVSITAATKTKEQKIVIDQKGVVSSLELSGDSGIYFQSGISKAAFMVNSDSISDKNMPGIKKGSSGSKNVAMMELNLEGSSFVLEKDTEATTFIKVGDIEKITSLQEEIALTASKISYKEEGGSIRFSFSSQPKTIRFFSLVNPERMVFDFVGIKGSISKAENIRSANHPGGFRIVVEKKLPSYFTVSSGKSDFAVKENGEKLFAGFKEMKEEKIAAVTVKKEQPETKKIEIDGIAFVGENPEILKINGSDKFEVVKNQSKGNLEIVIKNSFITKDKEQLIDAASLNGPVRELAIFNEGNDVKVIAKMNNKDFDMESRDTGSGVEFIFSAKISGANKEGVAGLSEDHAAKTVSAAMVSQATDSGAAPFAVNVEDQKTVYRGKKISLDFKDVDILDILRLMSEISKLNIITGDDVKGTVTVRLINIPWDEALDVILKSKSLGKERYGNIVRVASLSTIQREREAELAKKKADQKLEPIKVRLIAVNYAMANKLLPQIKDLLTERGSVNTDDRTNVLIVKDTVETLDKVEQLVQYLDTQTPQVLIEARIVEATSQAAQGFGISWGQRNYADVGHGNPTGAAFPYNMGIGAAVNVPGPTDKSGSLGFNFGSIGNISDLNLTLNVMESEGKIKIVSSPKVATLDNTEAMIQQGVSIPITTRGTTGEVTTKYVDATLILKSTPHITADGSILMDLNINKSEPDWSNTNYLGEPAIIKKETKTNILIKSGDTVVIGGVYTNKTSKTTRGIPWLMDIPILGWIFKSEEERVERSELLIFLTPRIMNKVKSTIPLQKSEEE